MDGFAECGIVDNSREGAALVAREIFYGNPVVFAWSPDGVNCYVFLIASSFKTLGLMPYGGHPVGRLYVAIYGLGCHHFPATDISYDYWVEKLEIDETNAKIWARFWKMILEERESLDTNLLPSNLVRLKRKEMPII